jgi:hypothetical protein
MRTATSLTVIAIGAIFAFAITSSPTFLNLQIVGWILILTGAGGMLLSNRSQNWLRRTIIVRGRPEAPRTRTRRRRVPQLAAAGAAAGAPASPAPATGVTPDVGLTQPIGTVERETIEEYLEP